jgi:hypothetical protein
MKKKITLLLLFVITISYSQEKSFKYDIKGLQPSYLVSEIDSLNQIELFNKTINWIKETYKNPDKVIKTTIENKKIRFTGSAGNFLSIRFLGTNKPLLTRYTIEISFKDGKYKFSPINLEYYQTASQYSSGGWMPVGLSNGTGYYKKKGKLRKMFREFPKDIPKLFNGLEASLKIYLLKENKTIKSTEDDW